MGLQGCLAHTKQPSPTTLQYASAYVPMLSLGGWAFLMSEVPLDGLGLSVQRQRFSVVTSN